MATFAARNEPPDRGALGKEDGHELVRGGKEDRHKRPQARDARRVERRRHGGEPALGHGAQYGAHDRPRSAAPSDHALDALAGSVLQRLHSDVGREQEGNEVHRVFDRVPGDMDEKLKHLHALTPTRRASLARTRRP